MEQRDRGAVISGWIVSTLVILFRKCAPVVFGILVRLGLYLRDIRLRTFIPLTIS